MTGLLILLAAIPGTVYLVKYYQRKLALQRRNMRNSLVETEGSGSVSPLLYRTPSASPVLSRSNSGSDIGGGAKISVEPSGSNQPSSLRRVNSDSQLGRSNFNNNNESEGTPPPLPWRPEEVTSNLSASQKGRARSNSLGATGSQGRRILDPQLDEFIAQEMQPLPIKPEQSQGQGQPQGGQILLMGKQPEPGSVLQLQGQAMSLMQQQQPAASLINTGSDQNKISNQRVHLKPVVRGSRHPKQQEQSTAPQPKTAFKLAAEHQRAGGEVITDEDLGEWARESNLTPLHHSQVGRTEAASRAKNRRQPTAEEIAAAQAAKQAEVPTNLPPGGQIRGLGQAAEKEDVNEALKMGLKFMRRKADVNVSNMNDE